MEEERAPRPAWGRWQRGDGGRGLPWRSTVLIAVIVMVGTGFAARNQPGRETLDVLGRALLLLGAAPLLFRHRRPVPVVFGVAAVTLGYLAAGYPYGPVFGLVGVACFAAVVHGHRTAAAWALGLLWAGHLLLSHWLYRWLPPGLPAQVRALPGPRPAAGPRRVPSRRHEVLLVARTAVG